MKQTKHTLISICIGLLCSILSIKAHQLPEIGAQVFIEPGQTAEEVESWFKTMHENGMKICRIRMFEAYMRQRDNSWDFSLFDRAFEMADKYDIKVMATFFPATEKTDIGGWKFPPNDQQLELFAEFIKTSVLHFKKFKSLYAWVLINEPGGGLHDNDFSHKMRTEWNKTHPKKDFLENRYPVLVDLQDKRFESYMTSWMLHWIATEVRKYDKKTHLHDNTHAIFHNLPEYDLVYWRTFLSSLGGSAHPSWHFTDFTRQQYALAMSANSEIILSGSGELPWIMTEIQGGNNTYSGGVPMCPTKEEITQWLWTVIGTEGNGTIFWSLNPRASGVEAGEWALLNFQHQATDRVKAIAEVTKCIQNNHKLFSKYKKVNPKITLLHIRESMWTESVITKGTPAAKDGRKIGMKNLLGYFKALSEIGISANIAAFEEFDFTKEDYSGETLILANQITVPSEHIPCFERFVERGGKLIADGLTGYYDEHVQSRMLTNWRLWDLFGGKLSEFKFQDNDFIYSLNADINIPATLWKGTIEAKKSSLILTQDKDNKTLATKHPYGKGEVIWIPGLVGMGAWKNAAPLAKWLKEECETSQLPFIFAAHHPNLFMKTLKTKVGYLTIIVNKSTESKVVKLEGEGTLLSPSPLYISQGNRLQNDKSIVIKPEATVVVGWQ